MFFKHQMESFMSNMADDDEDDLDSVDANEDTEYEAFLEELYLPSELDRQVNDEFSLDLFF